MNAAVLSQRSRAAGNEFLPPSATLDRLEPTDFEHEFSEAAREYAPRMLTVARRFLRSEDDAADAVQDAFVSAYKALPQFHGGSELSTWLHRILINACLMKIRSRKRCDVSLDSVLPTFDASGTGSLRNPSCGRPEHERLEREELRAVVRRGIDQLPDDYRTIVLLRDIEQFDTEETAAILGVAAGTVKTRLHRARQALRMLLEPVLFDDGESISAVDGNQFAAVASNKTR